MGATEASPASPTLCRIRGATCPRLGAAISPGLGRGCLLAGFLLVTPKRLWAESLEDEPLPLGMGPKLRKL